MRARAEGAVVSRSSAHARAGAPDSRQNQYVGVVSELPSGPICAVMPCISVGWKNSPPAAPRAHAAVSVELGAGPPLV